MDEETTRRGKEAYIKMSNEIVERVRRNLRNIDTEGFAHLTNAKKDGPAPIDFARGYGFVRPVFIVKEAYDRYGTVLKTHESWWVRDEAKYMK